MLRRSLIRNQARKESYLRERREIKEKKRNEIKTHYFNFIKVDGGYKLLN